MSITPDPDYDLVKPWATMDAPKRKKGSQCGQCGMKFDYGQHYGYSCGHNDCPMGLGSISGRSWLHTREVIQGEVGREFGSVSEPVEPAKDRG